MKMKNLMAWLRRECRRGQDLLQLSIWMAAGAVLLAAGTFGASIMMKNANGHACTRNLAKIDEATRTLCNLRNVTTAAEYAATATEASLKPYLDNRTFVGAAGQVKCPCGGTYAIGEWDDTNKRPNKPTCSLGQSGADSADNQAAKFHYLGADL
ncbi:MAG: hypothetical protein PHV34_18215 [Verrucomicrobiae bacterium]|nr:hypothetical protein [Verrucomicrobiae bacterium]